MQKHFENPAQQKLFVQLLKNYIDEQSVMWHLHWRNNAIFGKVYYKTIPQCNINFDSEKMQSTSTSLRLFTSSWLWMSVGYQVMNERISTEKFVL